jgi:dihydrofolate reductase
MNTMRKLVLIVHISLDGFVAGENGELDGFEAREENLEFVCQLTKEADAAMFGRKSFELLNRYWPTAKNHPGATKGEIDYSNWYNYAKKIVFSKTLPDSKNESTIIMREIIPDELIRLKKQDGRDILIFGSPSVAQQLMQYDLIDSHWIFINPATFGKGIPLYEKSGNSMKLKLLTIKEFGNGEVAMNYIKKITP